MQPLDYFTKHTLAAHNLTQVQKQSVNLVYLTDDFVLRLTRPELAGRVNHEREAELGLRAIELGLKTAKPVAWGAGYSIWERLPGGALTQPETCSPEIWHELLDTLESLHQNPLERQIPVDAWTGDPSLTEKTQELAHWTPDEKEQLTILLGKPHTVKTPCFIHGDAYPDNIIVADNIFVGLIDWGNAGWQALEAECMSLDDAALELALKRWHERLDLPLLWKMRLNLLLEVATYGRIPISEARAILGDYQRTFGS